jgi:HEAT repeat protein
MKSMLPFWRFPSVLAVLAVSLLGVCAQGQGRSDQPPWFDLESELNQRGVRTDSASLIDIARSNGAVGTRWMAIEILGLQKEQRAKEVLQQLLTTTNEPLLKETVALALARLGDPKGIPALEGLMRMSTDAERRIFMAARLAELGNASGYTYVAQAAAGNDPHLQYLSVGDLVSFLRYETGSSGIDPTNRLLTLLQHGDSKIRKEVLVHVALAITLGLPADRVRPIVEGLANEDRDESVREMARLTLISLR